MGRQREGVKEDELGNMELKGCNKEYWCGGGDYWNGNIILENALFQKEGTNIPKTPNKHKRAGGERQRVGIDAKINTLATTPPQQNYFFDATKRIPKGV